MKNDLEIRKKWQEEQPLYEEYGKQIRDEINDLLKKQAIQGEVFYRPKEIGSLMKKIYRKQKDYDEIRDKVGVRAVVQFRENLIQIDEEICKYYGYRIKDRDDKASTQTENTFGYQSIHYDIQDPTGTMFCELQIRTICQHNWSTLSHFLSYKKEENIPTNIKRQINALSALFEVADTQFQSINDEIKKLPASSGIVVYDWIVTQFLTLSSVDFDREMTNIFISNLSKFYKDENILGKLKKFYSENKTKLEQKISSDDSGVFYSQPEIFIILERLTNKKILLKSKWPELYPIELLESIAIEWGISLE